MKIAQRLVYASLDNNATLKLGRVGPYMRKGPTITSNKKFLNFKGRVDNLGSSTSMYRSPKRSLISRQATPAGDTLQGRQKVVTLKYLPEGGTLP